MPALRHLARRSARLRANTQEVRSNPMDPQASSSQRQPESNRQDTIKFAIQWERDHALTTILINHLTTHPPDCRILFYSDVANCITALKNKYKKCKAKFSATGAGGGAIGRDYSNNLLDEVNAELPWYTDLNSMWHSIPSLRLNRISIQAGG
ncbi:uncharacterized protein F5147DRAFT_775691 [Suillus discolor]|uniref:Uncharacterized protein n=1 Tax=Suillus discolor TaxID=1912936 RepID=A0A9P7F216_9AGAM|nr:uncharacterized protein F5147DRAFT_775691 [Suillus discolor]KAG2103986.1 hypothetical protein F5147DRAFT_775691 [Suillus discolor]